MEMISNSRKSTEPKSATNATEAYRFSVRSLGMSVYGLGFILECEVWDLGFRI
jgi:hypothetical protein